MSNSSVPAIETVKLSELGAERLLRMYELAVMDRDSEACGVLRFEVMRRLSALVVAAPEDPQLGIEALPSFPGLPGEVRVSQVVVSTTGPLKVSLPGFVGLSSESSGIRRKQGALMREGAKR